MRNEDPVPDLSQLAGLELRPLPGSERPPLAGFVTAAARPLLAAAPVEATVILRRRAEPGEDAYARRLTPEQLAEEFGAAPEDLDSVRTTLTRLGATIISADQASRRVRVAGSAAVMARIFGTDLQEFEVRSRDGHPTNQRHRSGPLSVPAELDGVVTAVLGLDDRPQSRALFRTASAAAPVTSYTPVELGAVYGFPEGYDGAGQTIAIIELGGGYVQADLDAYFGQLGLSTPDISAVGVDGGANLPGNDPNGADGEVMLDIEVAGALAPGATLLVYFAPNTDAGFIDAVTQAAHASPTPAAISISWGQVEEGWTEQARTAFDQALQDAVLMGVTVTAAAGDDGSSDRAADGLAHVDFPASSPHALGCGGTRLDADPRTGTVRSETVWNNGRGAGATGGGVSTAFPLPAWQSEVTVPSPNGHGGRGVPDVAAVADPQTGYRVRVDGQDTVIGGTSAVSPLWAALVARLVQATGQPLGLIQRVIYPSAAAASSTSGFRDITQGNNGAFQAGTGWDPCTGLGVPDGKGLLAMLKPKAA
ncbi:MAG: peptidase [Micrococcaceae bacterium]|nr:peptidase [Micrococcaceae bacterium]